MDNGTIKARVATCALILDKRAPGWAAKVPPAKLDVRKTDSSPLAFVIGPDWDSEISSQSALRLGAFALDATTASHANQAWRNEIALRQSEVSSAS